MLADGFTMASLHDILFQEASSVELRNTAAATARPRARYTDRWRARRS